MKNKKQIVKLNIFIVFIAFAYILLMILGNVRVAKISVATISGSYGEQYALDNNLNQLTLADSELKYFDQRYELFDYNVDGGEITLEKYDGKSEKLVIPSTIDGTDVTALGENFIPSLDAVDEIYLPKSIVEILGKADANITVYCEEDSILPSKFEGTNWKIETVFDSDFVDFNLGNNPFVFNQNGTEMEIVRYRGNDEFLVIPSYINGYPVTTVSMDLLGAAKVIVIPETVTSISGISNMALYSPVFMVELIFTILAFMIALITINILLPRYRKNTEEYLLTSSQIIAVILYVIAQTIFGIIATYALLISTFMATVVSVVILIVFILIIMLGGRGRKHVKEVDARIEEKTSRLKAIKDMSKNMASEVKNPQIRKQVQRLIDEIRFSDAVSRADLDDIESELEVAIQELKKKISTENEEEIKNATEKTMKILQERNLRCKSGK